MFDVVDGEMIDGNKPRVVLTTFLIINGMSSCVVTFYKIDTAMN